MYNDLSIIWFSIFTSLSLHHVSRFWSSIVFVCAGTYRGQHTCTSRRYNWSTFSSQCGHRLRSFQHLAVKLPPTGWWQNVFAGACFRIHLNCGWHLLHDMLHHFDSSTTGRIKCSANRRISEWWIWSNDPHDWFCVLITMVPSGEINKRFSRIGISVEWRRIV